jgi:hypothetical protein
MARKKRKRKLCLVEQNTHTVLERSHSRNELERSKKRFRGYTEEEMDIVTENELAERLAEQNFQAQQLREQQDFEFAKALARDKEKAEKRTLRDKPEERAKLFDALFRKRNPHYKPYLARVKI